MDANTGSEDRDARVLDYWVRRRQGLTKGEWTDFYQLVIPILLRTRLPNDYSNADKRKDLVNLFFAEKIFMNAATTKAGPLQNVHALHEYLKRFEKDLRSQLPPEEPLPEGAGQEPEAPAEPVALASLLAKAGIDTARAMHSADRFLKDLESGEVAYLRENTCVDKSEAKTIKSLADRWNMGTGFHHRARRLGITRSKGDTYHDYGETKIGQWLLSVGAKLQTDWQQEIAALLIVLCERARLKPREAP